MHRVPKDKLITWRIAIFSTLEIWNWRGRTSSSQVIRQPTSNHSQEICKCQVPRKLPAALPQEERNMQSQKPAILKTWNTFVGGVDLLEGLMHTTEFFWSARNSTSDFCFHVVGMAVVSSWLHYRMDCDPPATSKKQQLDVLALRASLASCPSSQNKDMKKRGGCLFLRKQRLTRRKQGDQQLQPLIHMFVKTMLATAEKFHNNWKIAGCKAQPVSFWTMCKIHLCINKTSNCFISFQKNWDSSGLSSKKRAISFWKQTFSDQLRPVLGILRHSRKFVPKTSKCIQVAV